MAPHWRVKPCVHAVRACCGGKAATRAAGPEGQWAGVMGSCGAKRQDHANENQGKEEKEGK